MGYQINFAPTEEAMAKYKPWKKDRYEDCDSDKSIEKYKQDLLCYCMNNTESSYVTKVYDDIILKLKLIYSCVESSEKYSAYFRWKDDEDKELWYCGWEFSHEANSTKENDIKYYAEELFVLACMVKTPDYFDDNEKFYNKLSRIKEIIDAFIENSSDLAIHGIIEELRDFEIKYDDEGNRILPKSNNSEKESDKIEKKDE